MDSESKIVDTQEHQNSSPNIIGWVVGVVAIAIVYGLINLVLVGGQKVWHSGDQKKLTQIQSILDDEKKDLDRIEGELTSKNANLDKLEIDLKANKNGNIDRYNKLVDEYNMKLGAYNQQYDDYKKRITSYNDKVNEANSIAKKIGSTWYVVPIPVGKK
jgi:hypothetical protein